MNSPFAPRSAAIQNASVLRTQATALPAPRRAGRPPTVPAGRERGPRTRHDRPAGSGPDAQRHRMRLGGRAYLCLAWLFLLGSVCLLVRLAAG